jgi:hypothetical protein
MLVVGLSRAHEVENAKLRREAVEQSESGRIIFPRVLQPTVLTRRYRDQRSLEIMEEF